MVFVGRRRQRSHLLVTALAVRADGARPRLQVGRIDVVLRARILLHLLARPAEQPGAPIVNWVGIELRIDHCEVEVQVTDVGTRPALDSVELVAVRIRILVGPGSRVLKCDGIDDEGVAVPTTHVFAEEGRVGVIAVFAAIGGNQAIGCVPIEKCNLIGAFEPLERQRAGIVARNATDDAKALGINRVLEIVLERGAARLGKWQFIAGEILADVS